MLSPSTPKCVKPECNAKPRSRGMCNRHYIQWRAAQPLDPGNVPGEKTCTKCGELKPILAFARCAGPKDGRRSDCKECHKAYHVARRAAGLSLGEPYRRRWLWRMYKLTLEEYVDLLKKHEYKCAICGCHQDNLPGSRRWLSVDHNHNTGAVRGLLCGPCNFGIGQFSDDPELIERAASYLRGYASGG